MALVLESAGYRVLQASDATTAIATSRAFEDRIDLLISDLTMPDMDGREVARIITADRPECRVLLISGYPAELLPNEAVPTHPPAFLQKPFVPRVLLERVRDLIDNASR